MKIKTETLVTLIDISPSMEAEDYAPSRLAGAIQANRELIRTKALKFPQDQVGVIGFSEQAYLFQSPVPAGENQRTLLGCLTREMPETYGTDFLAALKMASNLLSGKPPKTNPAVQFLKGLFIEPQTPPAASKTLSGRIILLTDGDHNGSGNPVKCAGKLKTDGVVIECVGIAGDRADVNEDLLKQIASPDKHGRPRYRFIGDTAGLIREYKTMANQIRAV